MDIDGLVIIISQLEKTVDSVAALRGADNVFYTLAGPRIAIVPLQLLTYYVFAEGYG